MVAVEVVAVDIAFERFAREVQELNMKRGGQGGDGGEVRRRREGGEKEERRRREGDNADKYRLHEFQRYKYIR